MVKRLFAVPPSETIEWRQVGSLLEALDAVTEEHDGKLEVTLGGEVEVFERPHGKDVDKEMIADLRRMPSRATDVSFDRCGSRSAKRCLTPCSARIGSRTRRRLKWK